MLMMRPPIGSCLRIAAKAAREHRNVPVRLTETTAFQASTGDLVDCRGLVAHAGIVEEQVDPAERLGDGLEHVVDLIGPGHVADDGQRAGIGLAGIANGFIERIFAATAKDGVPTVLEQGCRHCLADALASTGDHRDPVACHDEAPPPCA
ncbi:hypothetical protein HNQ96_003117 [Aminobacter lissarensis]|uniref:Uncharacterized protein n=1 Tax=Aminobacter carboxidus TaxID=376165 RepID=A0A8E1WFA2_9HYPH|nr:hypothetical protein [Aminobacter lissarensis]